MRIRRSAPAAIVAICVLLASPALADEFTRKGYYAAVHAAYGFELVDTDTFARIFGLAPAAVDADDAWGFNIRVGQRMKSWLGIELEYEWMDGVAIDQEQVTPFPGKVRIATYNPDVVTLNARFYAPVWLLSDDDIVARTQPYLLVGGGLVSYDIQFEVPRTTFSRRDNAFAFRGGAGLDVYLTKNIVLNVEGTFLLNTDTFTVAGLNVLDSLYYVTANGGIAYRF
jgi:opacity protein-like surface antigen